MHLAASAESISVVLLTERKERQVPIYFVRRVLQGAEFNYSALEKLILALVYATRRLSGAGLMLINPEGKEYTYALRFRFKTTNNKADYEALPEGLRIAREMEIRSLAMFTDSQLMVNQLKGLFEASQLTIKQYLQKVNEILKGFDTYTIEHIRQNQNKKADALSKLALMTFEHLTKEALVEVLVKRSPSQADNVIKEIHEGSCGFNTEPHSMVVKVMKQEQFVAKKLSKKDAIAVGNTWPFSHWGVNILGPLLTAPRSFKFLAIAVEHSTKWVEAKPLTTMNEKQAKKFPWEHIVRGFEVPQTISSKDDKQYNSKAIILSAESLAPEGKGYATKENAKRK
ncbi:reverse transcriptase domain-containing protein [Tanacetum coccineum]|uniref:Reverse transcriptase domain-containing protein n=1 Tax=Tanacetum coccineum TaxID=301880 RepID=A0ABQ4ZFC4_9ASTR